MLNKINCIRKKHKEYEVYTIKGCKIALCNHCHKVGLVRYRVVQDACITYEVEWLSNKETNQYLNENNTTIRAQAIKYVYKNKVR